MSIKERFERDKECTIQYYVSELLHLDLSDYLKKQFQNRNSSIGKPVKLVVDDGNIYKIVRNEEIINTVAD